MERNGLLTGSFWPVCPSTRAHPPTQQDGNGRRDLNRPQQHPLVLNGDEANIFSAIEKAAFSVIIIATAAKSESIDRVQSLGREGDSGVRLYCEVRIDWVTIPGNIHHHKTRTLQNSEFLPNLAGSSPFERTSGHLTGPPTEFLEPCVAAAAS